MDSLGLCAVAAELRQAADGRRFGVVVLPRREQLAVSLGPGLSFFVSILPGDARCHLAGELPPSPAAESGLQTHFDSLLRGAALVSVETVAFDRVLRLELAGEDRIGRPRALTLIVELMGKHSACVVLDADGVILATLKTVTHAVNRHRELLARLPYVPPPDGGRRDPRGLTHDDWQALWPQLAGDPRRGWRTHLFGLSDELWEHLTARCGPTLDRESLWAAWQSVVGELAAERWQPCLRRGEDGTPRLAWPLPLPDSEPVPSFSAALAQLRGTAAQVNVLRERRGQVVGALEKALARVDSRLLGIERAARKFAEAGRWQHQADLLLAHLHLLKPGLTTITLPDWEDPEGGSVTLPLDPTLSGSRHAEVLYDRARRARRAAEELPAHRPALEAERAELVAQLERARAATSLAELAWFHEPGAGPGGKPAKPRTERERWLLKLERHTSADGYLILVGRNAAESEGLLSRVASPSDLWLHVRGAGSGHVIVRAEGKPDAVPRSTLEEAARWAARHSKMKHSELVPVVYTQRRYVTKVTGGAAGKVVYKHEKLLMVEP